MKTFLKSFYQWRAMQLARKATRVLTALDDAMKYAHLSRAERRQTWRAVIAGRLNPTDLIR